MGGAVALIDEAGRARVWDTPTGQDKKRSIYMPREMLQLFAKNVILTDPVMVFIEKVHSMPKQGVASSFNFGHGYGLWIGIVTALELPIEYVSPVTWMKEMFKGRPIGKDASRALAQEKWPYLVDQLNLVKHHGRSDALLIAEYGRRTLGGQT